VITLETTATPSSEDDVPFGLSKRALDLLRGVFSDYPAVDRAIIYGSRAMVTTAMALTSTLPWWAAH
jgi:hypothetical protein